MGVVAEVADSVAVMYAGRIVEQGTAVEVFDRQRHPYTQALLRTLHDMRRGRAGAPLFQIEGQPPSLNTPIPGCPFHPCCPLASELCRRECPELIGIGADRVACHHALGTRVVTREP